MLNEKTLYAMGQLIARTAREKAAQTGAAANEVIDLCPLLTPWQEGPQAAGEVVVYEGYPYRTITSHDSTGNPAWNPAAAPALFAPYHGTDRAHALPWRAPTGAQDAYGSGEWMIFTDGIAYRCTQDGTVWGPDTLMEAWEAGA